MATSGVHLLHPPASLPLVSNVPIPNYALTAYLFLNLGHSGVMEELQTLSLARLSFLRPTVAPNAFIIC